MSHTRELEIRNEGGRKEGRKEGKMDMVDGWMERASLQQGRVEQEEEEGRKEGWALFGGSAYRR